VTEADASAIGYRGKRLGLPEYGQGSLASFGRRLGALCLDWLACELVAILLTHGHVRVGSTYFSAVVLGIFALEVFVLTWLGGASFGQRLVHVRVVPLNDRPIGPLRALIRTILICLVVPPLIWDRDGRGMHDRAGLTAVINLR
jgi:uncharacterized RDD family membrane protein YckC